MSDVKWDTTHRRRDVIGRLLPQTDDEKERRFWSFVQIGEDDICWPWIGRFDNNGYGRFHWGNGRSYNAYRIAYELHYKIILPREGRSRYATAVLHDCDNPPCCNPHHLKVGTKASNFEEMVIKKRHAFGSLTFNAKLTEYDVPIIRQKIISGEFLMTIAKDFGVSFRTVYDIKHGLTWKQVP